MKEGQAVEEEDQAVEETQANHPGDGGGSASIVQVRFGEAERIMQSDSQGLRLEPGATFGRVGSTADLGAVKSKKGEAASSIAAINACGHGGSLGCGPSAPASCPHTDGVSAGEPTLRSHSRAPHHLHCCCGKVPLQPPRPSHCRGRLVCARTHTSVWGAMIPAAAAHAPAVLCRMVASALSW